MDLICVPTSGRAKRQQTLWHLQIGGITKSHRVVAVVYADEAADHKRMAFKGHRIKDVEVIVVPDGYRGIAGKREFIITKLARRLGTRYVMILDDDLSFCWRPNLDDVDMPYINPDHDLMARMVGTLTRWLKEKRFIHTALISRQANRQTGMKWLQPSRAMNAHAFDTLRIRKLMRKGLVKFGRVKLMEDFDLTLQLLRLGYPNRVSTQFAWTTVSNLKGGCSAYRTEKMQRRAARQLAELHEGYIRLVKRRSKTWAKNRDGKGFADRLDVRCSWKKAYAAGKVTRASRRRAHRAAKGVVPVKGDGRPRNLAREAPVADKGSRTRPHQGA